jgi:dolichol-phosphate mannosyltransferase
MKQKESLTVVIPVYNEESCLEELIARLLKLKNNSDNVEFSFIFVNDGSRDKSLDILTRYAETYSFFKIINLSRNFGHQMAITAGIDYVDSDYVAVMDADLQDPPELIEKLYEKIKEGYDVVYAKRIKRKGESFLKLATARLFYYFINKLGRIDFPLNTGDFRLFNHKVLNTFKNMREQHRFIRGMIPWLGFNSTPVYYERDRRFAGNTKYPFRKMFIFALDAIFSFSNAPLRIGSYIGLFMISFAILGGILMLYLRFFTSYYVPGIPAVILSIILLSGVQIFMIGIVGEYIGRIFQETKNRPLYIVDRLTNFPSKQKE